eukprot:m.1519966 g.1519966  ORF g.1519966 m.1519966 type:complete len:308 (-) comp25226_c0_seq11:6041-6964(-)
MFHFSCSSHRLWGDHGQKALSDASICCLGAGALATETLKNLVLPGIGSFTIVDPQLISAEDCGNNFFVTRDKIGQPRAHCATELLAELNDEVHGDWIQEDAEVLLATRPEFFKDFSVVIAAQIPESTVLSLAAVLWDANIPLVVVRAYGMLGYMRVAVQEHCIVETHPSDPTSDMRLTRPFPALAAFCESFAFDTLSTEAYQHIPFAVVLYQQLQKWKLHHNGLTPSNFKEKRNFKDEILSSIRSDVAGETGLIPENFDEAAKAVNTALSTATVEQCRKLVCEMLVVRHAWCFCEFKLVRVPTFLAP